MSDYPAAVKRQMVRFYVSLNERDRRRYAAVEAQKLGHGVGTGSKENDSGSITGPTERAFRLFSTISTRSGISK